MNRIRTLCTPTAGLTRLKLLLGFFALLAGLLVPGASWSRSSQASSLSDNAFPDWSSTGQIVFEGEGGLMVVKPDGTGLKALPNTAFDGTAAWSPDGSRLAVQVRRDGNYTLALIRPDGSGRMTIVRENRKPFWPDWSPDGKRILFVGSGTIFIVNADGSGETALAGTGGDPLDHPNWPDWSPDGGRIVFAGGLVLGGPIRVLDLATGAVAVLTTGKDDHPAWSPDGSRIAFTRDVGNYRRQIFVMNADGSGQRRVTTNILEDEYPTWSPDGRRIAFHRGDDQGREVWVMNADGSGQRRLTGGPAPRAANGRPCTVQGTSGPDLLVGTPGKDVLCGLGGDDRILGGAGQDVVDGGPGLDRLVGGPGDDVLFSRDGIPDTVDGGPGRDRARVDRGFDRLFSVERVF